MLRGIEKVGSDIEAGRLKRHLRIRKKVVGTKERPRLCIHRSNANLSVQAIDDLNGHTLYSSSTLNKEVKSKSPYGGNVKAAISLGEVVAQGLKAKGLTRVVFDRGGYLYHGRIKAFAEACRKGGISF